MKNLLTKMWKDESGISSVEYALLLAFVGGGVIIGAELLGTAVGDSLTAAADCVDPAVVACAM